MAEHKITNGEYLEFVKRGAGAPHFWACREGQWHYHGMFEDIPLPLDWPVYVSYDEAQSYARWKGMSLPTEEQFQRVAYDQGNFDGQNVNFRRWDPEPVTASAPNSFGVSQLVGNGWEWTATKFAPFEGFQSFPFYPGYSANFFDGQHYVLKGGSPRTARACYVPVSATGFGRRIRTFTPHSAWLRTDPRAPMFASDVREGLSHPIQKTLPCQYFYDAVGSALFEVITVLPEYGLTRADNRLIRRLAPELGSHMRSPVTIAELGSGSGWKTRRILEALAIDGPATYFPIDVSATALARCALEMAAVAVVRPIEASYLDGLRQAVCAEARDTRSWCCSWAAPSEISTAARQRSFCGKCGIA